MFTWCEWTRGKMAKGVSHGRLAAPVNRPYP
jgi:hypothetical protein